jgi:hypothetical protein
MEHENATVAKLLAGWGMQSEIIEKFEGTYLHISTVRVQYKGRLNKSALLHDILCLKAWPNTGRDAALNTC